MPKHTKTSFALVLAGALAGGAAHAGDGLFNDDYVGLNAQFSTSSAERFASALKGSVGIGEHFSLYGSLGISTDRVDTRDNAGNIDGYYDFDLGRTSLGFRLYPLAFERLRLALGAERAWVSGTFTEYDAVNDKTEKSRHVGYGINTVSAAVQAALTDAVIAEVALSRSKSDSTEAAKFASVEVTYKRNPRVGFSFGLTAPVDNDYEDRNKYLNFGVYIFF